MTETDEDTVSVDSPMQIDVHKAVFDDVPENFTDEEPANITVNFTAEADPDQLTTDKYQAWAVTGLT